MLKHGGFIVNRVPIMVTILPYRLQKMNVYSRAF